MCRHGRRVPQCVNVLVFVRVRLQQDAHSACLTICSNRFELAAYLESLPHSSTPSPPHSGFLCPLCIFHSASKEAGRPYTGGGHITGAGYA
jgi:hypothetical protein